MMIMVGVERIFFFKLFQCFRLEKCADLKSVLLLNLVCLSRVFWTTCCYHIQWQHHPKK